MKHSDFSIGKEFKTEYKKWRCTDVGTRVVIAIELKSPNGDDTTSSWYDGPPYAVEEFVFDEYDLKGCYDPSLKM